MSEIINVNYSVATNPARVTLTLREESELGREIAFIPRRQSWMPLTAPPIARADLRIDAARRPHDEQ